MSIPAAYRATREHLVESNGVLVVKGKFQVGEFIRNGNQKVGRQSYFNGTWDDLERLVTTHQHNFEPGIGSVNNDVILVRVPADGFYTPIARITPENAHLVEERLEARREGEKPVPSKVIRGTKPPATVVKIVCYRADVLAQDNDRTTTAEWEIIAILAQDEENVPMDPVTMLRNSNHEVGGTYREYTQDEWDKAYAYWDTHAYVEEPDDEGTVP